MSGERGYTLAELVIATAIMVTMTAAIFGLLHDGLAAAPIIEETTDLHQRVRVAADALASELRLAAAGTPTGPLSGYFAAIAPRGPADPPGAVSPAALTVRYVPPGGAHSRLLQPLDPGMPAAVVEAVQGCPGGTTACGFVAGARAVVFDTSGHAAFIQVDAIGPGILTISDSAGPRAVSYPAGAEIAEAVQAAYFLDPAARQLRRHEGGGSFVVADNVIALSFAYYDADMRLMPLTVFEDGPFIGAGATASDADVLRVRSVRATLRLATGVDSMRGGDPRLFARPGRATGSRTITDIITGVDVSLRNWR